MSKARPPFSARGIPSSVAPTATLRRHVEALEVSAKGRFEAGAKKAKVRRFKEFYDGAASWSRVERIIARVEAGEEGGSSLPISQAADRRRSTRTFTVGAAARKITSNPGRPISPHLVQQGHRQSVPPVPARPPYQLKTPPYHPPLSKRLVSACSKSAHQSSGA